MWRNASTSFYPAVDPRREREEQTRLRSERARPVSHSVLGCCVQSRRATFYDIADAQPELRDLRGDVYTYVHHTTPAVPPRSPRGDTTHERRDAPQHIVSKVTVGRCKAVDRVSSISGAVGWERWAASRGPWGGPTHRIIVKTLGPPVGLVVSPGRPQRQHGPDNVDGGAPRPGGLHFYR